MVTYADLFAFVIMLCAVITLVIYIIRKKQRPCLGRLDATFCKLYICRRLGGIQLSALLSSLLYPFPLPTSRKNNILFSIFFQLSKQKEPPFYGIFDMIKKALANRSRNCLKVCSYSGRKSAAYSDFIPPDMGCMNRECGEYRNTIYRQNIIDNHNIQCYN